jgi:hypothetical protein
MERHFSKFYPQKWAQIALLVGFCFVLYFVNLGQWDLWNPDEPRGLLRPHLKTPSCACLPVGRDGDERCVC